MHIEQANNSIITTRIGR